MKCPACGGSENKVIDSRTAMEGDAIRRRRECESCGARFTTYEQVERTQVLVIKKDGRREPFRREKLDAGITTACGKRPVPREAIESLLDRVEMAVHAMGQREVESRQVGEIVMKELAALDQVSYVRFASVYREFRDVNDFMQEIRRTLTSGKKEGE